MGNLIFRHITMKFAAALFLVAGAYASQTQATATTLATAEVEAAIQSVPSAYSAGKVIRSTVISVTSLSSSDYTDSSSYGYPSDSSDSTSDYSDNDHGYGYRYRRTIRTRKYYRYRPRFYSNRYYYGRRYATARGTYYGGYRNYGYRSYGYGRTYGY